MMKKEPQDFYSTPRSARTRDLLIHGIYVLTVIIFKFIAQRLLDHPNNAQRE